MPSRSICMKTRSNVFPMPGYIWLLLGLATSLAAQSDRVTKEIDEAQTVRLEGRIHPGANLQNDRGRVEAGFSLTGMTLFLKPSTSQFTALQQLLDDQQNQASVEYHRWLTPEQYAARFGISAADIARLTGWLRSKGFTVGKISRSRTWVVFNGSARQAESAFHSEIHRYEVNGEMHFSATVRPSLPAALADVVTGMDGLDDFINDPRRPGVISPATSSNGNHTLAPDDWATIYDVAPLYQAGIDGTGQAI